MRTTLDICIAWCWGDWLLLEGFYKVRFQVNDAVGRSVMYAHGGSMLGGNFSGTCDEQGALLEPTALAGKRSLRLTAVLKLMRRA